MKQTKIVLYHNHCQDGFFSAYLFWTMFGDDAIYIPVLHRPIIDLHPLQSLQYIFKDKGIETNLETLKNFDLYVVDFCFPTNHIEVYRNLFKSMITLDHHESAFLDSKKIYKYEINELDWAIFNIADNCKIIISRHESAVKLLHMYYFPDKEVPWYLELISDNDLMKYKLQDTELFYHGVTLYKPYEFSCIKKLIENNFKDILELGCLVKRNRLGFIVDIIKSQLLKITCIERLTNNVYNGALINSELSNSNDIGTYVMNVIKKYDFCIIYNIRNDEIAHCSIRSNDNFNSLLISEKYKGGGHKLSGGFPMYIDHLTEIINEKVLFI